MNNKAPALVSGLLAGFFLFLIGIIAFFGLIVALNDARPNQATIAMAIAIFCQLLIWVSGGIFAAKFAKFLAVKWKGRKILAVTIAVVSTTLLGGLFSFVSIIVSILLAGIR